VVEAGEAIHARVAAVQEDTRVERVVFLYPNFKAVVEVDHILKMLLRS
jgi:hypothetical protein